MFAALPKTRVIAPRGFGAVLEALFYALLRGVAGSICAALGIASPCRVKLRGASRLWLQDLVVGRVG